MMVFSHADLEKLGFSTSSNGGHKEYSDEEGKATEVLEWFGYKLHVLCDARHEVALAYRISCGHDFRNLPTAP